VQALAKVSCLGAIVLSSVLPVASLGVPQASRAQPPGPQPCSDIAQIDLNNLTIATKGSGFGEIFEFRDGIAHRHDGSYNPSDPPDWEARIEKDQTITPSPGVKVRFVSFLDDHLTGTGTWSHVVGFRCSPANRNPRGHMETVFDQGGLSLELKKLDDTGVVISLNAVPNQPIVKYSQYSWDQHLSRFAVKKTWFMRWSPQCNCEVPWSGKKP
jgi:hypothetical protein